MYEIQSGKFGRKLSFITITDLCRENNIELDKQGYEELVSEDKVSFFFCTIDSKILQFLVTLSVNGEFHCVLSNSIHLTMHNKLRHWRISVHGPLWDPILLISYTFSPKSARVGGPCSPNWPTPPNGKSWIRHCKANDLDCINSVM